MTLTTHHPRVQHLPCQGHSGNGRQVHRTCFNKHTSYTHRRLTGCGVWRPVRVV